MPDIVLENNHVPRMRTKCGRVYYQLRRLLDAVWKEDAAPNAIVIIAQEEAKRLGLSEDWAAMRLECISRSGTPARMWCITSLGAALYRMRIRDSGRYLSVSTRKLIDIIYDNEFPDGFDENDDLGSELEQEAFFEEELAVAESTDAEAEAELALEESPCPPDEEWADCEYEDAPEDDAVQAKPISWVEVGGRPDLGHRDSDGMPVAYLALEMDGCIGAGHSDDWVCDIGKEQDWPKRVTGGVFERNTKYMLAAMNEYEAAFYKILVKHPEWGTRDPWRQVLLDCVLYGGEEIENPAITFYNTIREFDAPGDGGCAIRRRDGATWALDEAADAAEFVNVWAWLWDNRPSMPRIQLAQRMITGLDIDWNKLGL